DLNALKPEVSQIGALVAQLAERGIRIYAIESKDIQELGTDLPPLLIGAREAVVEEHAASAAPARAEEPAASTSLIIEDPIRSGQSVYHPHGDVIVLGSAGFGSEIIAGGSIHVYGTLRGRAIAGASGNR